MSSLQRNIGDRPRRLIVPQDGDMPDARVPQRHLLPDAAELPPAPMSAAVRSNGEVAATRKPLVHVLWQLPEPLGSMRAAYHDVRRAVSRGGEAASLYLFLGYDHKEGGAQHVWFPSVATDAQTGDWLPEQPLYGLLVYADGQPDMTFTLWPTDAYDMHDGYEFCFVEICSERSCVVTAEQ